jgi:hypothetical protein
MRLRIRATFPMAGMRAPMWLVERKRLWWWVQVGTPHASYEAAEAVRLRLSARPDNPRTQPSS